MNFKIIFESGYFYVNKITLQGYTFKTLSLSSSYYHPNAGLSHLVIDFCSLIDKVSSQLTGVPDVLPSFP